MAGSEFDYEGTLEACAAGDRAAFKRLYQQEAGQLLGLAITLLELFVAFLQAFIFTFLTTLFIGQAVVLHHDEGHGEPAHGH